MIDGWAICGEFQLPRCERKWLSVYLRRREVRSLSSGTGCSGARDLSRSPPHPLRVNVSLPPSEKGSDTFTRLWKGRLGLAHKPKEPPKMSFDIFGGSAWVSDGTRTPVAGETSRFKRGQETTSDLHSTSSPHSQSNILIHVDAIAVLHGLLHEVSHTRGTTKQASPTRQAATRSIAYLFRFLHIHRLGLLVGKAVRYEQARQWVVWVTTCCSGRGRVLCRRRTGC